MARTRLTARVSLIALAIASGATSALAQTQTAPQTSTPAGPVKGGESVDTGAATNVDTSPLPANAVAPTPESLAPSGTPAAQDIVVTGSRIGRRDDVAQSPILTTTQAAIENAGSTTPDQYLVQLPQFQPGTGGFTNPTSGGNVGQATLNLRGLGPQRNLILLDGRRLVPANSQQTVDINSIPQVAIGSLEVISGGASATYGSDAVAGVVNFKLRRGFEGVEANAQYNVSDKGDGASRTVSAVVGHRFAQNRGSVMVAGEFTQRDALSSQQRPFFEFGPPSTTLPQGYYVPNGANLPTAASINGVFATYGVAAGSVSRTNNLGFNDDGTLFRNGFPNYNYRGPLTQPFETTVTAFGYNSLYDTLIQIPLKRFNGFARADFDVSDALKIYAQGYYVHSTASSQGSPPTLAAPWQLDIPVTNPFVPAALRTILATRPSPTATFTLNKRALEFGRRAFTNDSDQYQVLIGVTGSIPGTSLTYDLYGSHGETSQTERTTSGAVSISALRRLTSAADGGASLCTGGYNPFGLTVLSQSCAAFLARYPVNRTSVDQDVVEGTVSGGIFDLPAGPLKFAATGTYRRNGYTFDPDPSYASGDIASISATSFTKGSVTVAEGALELLVPVVKDVPLVKDLNVSLGYRYSHYNTSGGVSTYKADLDWRVVTPLLIRGGYQRAVRAPNTAELFLAPGNEVTTIGAPPAAGDPCDVRSSYRTGANAAQVRALCIATGLNAAIADSFQQTSTAIITQTSGNNQLQPEKANTYTIGGVLQRSFLGTPFRRFTISVDYYNIKIKDAIAVLSAATSLQNCFNGSGGNPTYDPTNYYCRFFGRDPVSGLFTQATQPYLNLGGYRTSGIDIAADWRLPIDFVGAGAAVTLSGVANYLSSFQVQNLPGGAFQEFADTISSSTSYPRWKTVTSLTLDVGALQIGGRWRFIDNTRDSSAVTNPASPAAGVPSYSYFDLNVRLRAGKDFELRGGVTNLTDKAPPIVGGVIGTTNPGVYDVLGRVLYIGTKFRF